MIRDEIVGEVRIKRGIFQGDMLSPLLSVISVIPFKNFLRKASSWYEVASNKAKIIHSVYMDDLKSYERKISNH